jgi:hypothetical protein
MLAIVRTLLVLSVIVVIGTPVHSQRRSDVLTAAQIDSGVGKGGTAYDAVRMLRPRWLVSREAMLTGRPDDMVAGAGPHIYVNDHDVGDADYLKTIPAELVAELRWLSANQAASRFGPASAPGIVVTFKLPN